MTHLWEVDHPYYCNESNYFANGHNFEWESWAEFYEEYGDADKDYNLVFRWDWQDASADTEQETDLLKVFFMGQRRGYYFSCTVNVTKDDEPLVREYLMGYAEHMRSLWEPLL